LLKGEIPLADGVKGGSASAVLQKTGLFILIDTSNGRRPQFEKEGEKGATAIFQK